MLHVDPHSLKAKTDRQLGQPWRPAVDGHAPYNTGAAARIKGQIMSRWIQQGTTPSVRVSGCPQPHMPPATDAPATSRLPASICLPMSRSAVSGLARAIAYGIDSYSFLTVLGLGPARRILPSIRKFSDGHASMLLRDSRMSQSCDWRSSAAISVYVPASPNGQACTATQLKSASSFRMMRSQQERTAIHPWVSRTSTASSSLLAPQRTDTHATAQVVQPLDWPAHMESTRARLMSPWRKPSGLGRAC